ncbi:serine/threonine-protein kinase [Nocardiopsis sp. MG754419]|uniref:serine/threonine-protein kinase n=1 Tax=Nocardiopsis sp. MG754419 TaxID=2259865 RepID=UPI001BA7E119|nr:serine/threonine-protein kinase [Nocardiopsis sp. MG754419]MBR8742265.1 serine/threonine protein kinase [Nocardiopsis sp. MG754419]
MDTYEPSSQNGPGGLTGTVLSDRYRLEEQIGSGGMGTVWRATDTLLNRSVAVKLLHPAQMAEPTARERFRTEGRITAGLSHPGIAQVYDYGEEHGRAFLIMELVVSEPLSQVLREQGGLSPDQTLDFVCQAAKALAAAHARGVVHRDIKPGNLLVAEDGQLKLTDFGIARGDMSVTLTQTGMVMGTAQYISPEQASGRPATGASDLYALGVVAYECLAGQPPFTGDSPVALALAHTRDDPPPLPEHIPADIDDLVFSLLEKDPEDRPSSAGEVAHLAAVIRSNAGTGPPTPATGFNGMAQTRVVGAIPDGGPRSGASGQVRRTADQAAVTPDQGGDSTRLTQDHESGRRVRTPVVLAAVAATVLIVGAAVAGFMMGGTDNEPVNDGNPPAVTDQSPSPTPSEEPEVTEEPEVPQTTPQAPEWNPPPQNWEDTEPQDPGEGEEDTAPPEDDGTDGSEDEEPGGEDPGADDPGDGGGGEEPGPPPGNGEGNGPNNRDHSL